MKKQTNIILVAYHEAGHAIAHHFLHLPFKYVTIEKEDISLGHLLPFPNPKSFRPDIDSENYRTRIRTEKEIMASFAGHAAEYKFTKRKNWSGAGRDNHTATGLAVHFCGGSTKQAGAFLDWLWIRTMEWISNPLHWLCVEAVANELVDKHKLKASEVRKVIKETINKKFNERSIKI